MRPTASAATLRPITTTAPAGGLAAIGAALKRIPIDLGQASLRERTMGKLLAMDSVPPALPGQRALDVGCREGIQTRWLERRGYEVVSIDKEPQYAPAQAVDVDDGLPLGDAEVDVVWCSEVIEHLRDPAAAIGEFRRVLRPGGTMVLTTPNSHFWLCRLGSLVGLTPQVCQNRDHKWFFDEAEVRALCPRAEISGYFPYAVWKRRITRGVGALSPTFVIVERADS